MFTKSQRENCMHSHRDSATVCVCVGGSKSVYTNGKIEYAARATLDSVRRVINCECPRAHQSPVGDGMEEKGGGKFSAGACCWVTRNSRGRKTEKSILVHQPPRGPVLAFSLIKVMRGVHEMRTAARFAEFACSWLRCV